jgi:ERCC4-related helicase
MRHRILTLDTTLFHHVHSSADFFFPFRSFLKPLDHHQNAFCFFSPGARTVLVTTDLAARGLDTTHVRHVVLFDFPLTPVDYLHRVGRTARANLDGRVTALVTKHDRPLATAIQVIRAGFEMCMHMVTYTYDALE